MIHLQIPLDDPRKDVMPKINGQSYRCECGCNVFRWAYVDRLKCNGCGALYEAIRKEIPCQKNPT